MIPDWKLQELLALVRQKYVDWTDFNHPEFIADELAPKRATAVRAADLLNRETLDTLIAAGEFAEIHRRLLTVAHDNNLLWRQVPGVGDTAVLNHPQLDLPPFCTQIRNLLHGERSAPQRLASFSTYCADHDLPNKWPLPTYLLFFTHPQTEFFVKPRTARWFWQFIGESAPKRSRLRPLPLSTPLCKALPPICRNNSLLSAPRI